MIREKKNSFETILKVVCLFPNVPVNNYGHVETVS